MRNTTNQNRAKAGKLSCEHVIPRHCITDERTCDFLSDISRCDGEKDAILFSIGRKIAGENDNPAYREILSEYSHLGVVDVPDELPGEPDLLGITYQFLNSKRENLSHGTFYTPPALAREMISDLSFGSGQVMLDPACGSGNILLSSDAPADRLVGIDSDPIAVMLAKFNYFLRFPDGPAPRIYRADFFAWLRDNEGERFDYVIGNPPYGADLDGSVIGNTRITSGESFSLFIEKGIGLLSDNGILRFLVPESINNIRRHSDIRALLLEDADLVSIKNCGHTFSGVMSDIYFIEARRLGNAGSLDSVIFDDGKETNSISKEIYRTAPHNLFLSLSPEDVSVMDKMRDGASFPLEDADYALGIVTGGNKDKLFGSPSPGTEPIYSGKEIIDGVYRFCEPRNHIVYDRKNLQQVAPDAMYRAKQKLVYKAISKRLVFVLDESGALTLNSANIVIPRDGEHEIAAVLAILNSSSMSFYHIKAFGGVNKIAKENLRLLPFPALDEEQERALAELARMLMDEELEPQKRHEMRREIDSLLYGIYGFSKDEIERIEEQVSPI